ncbi:hypothetical protein LshimejAT787_2001370 [Lyophyllum shimeji]|uniref:Uncharacterized protein n=1 Tax=Lyophyllum shimeji TaxID=47721 RepID=A0A9P3PY71_LYOSH|nr:hypothetical protein LshimejAT787_2001370 [Lyophyllum shimeji]
MSEPTNARQVDPRLMIKLNPASCTSHPYQRKKTEELEKMERLTNFLKPNSSCNTSLTACPSPASRYLLTRDVFAHFIEKDGIHQGRTSPCDDCQVLHVYGTPEDEPDAVLFELADNYSVNHHGAPEVEEKLRKVLRGRASEMRLSSRTLLQPFKCFEFYKVVFLLARVQTCPFLIETLAGGLQLLYVTSVLLCAFPPLPLSASRSPLLVERNIQIIVLLLILDLGRLGGGPAVTGQACTYAPRLVDVAEDVETRAEGNQAGTEALQLRDHHSRFGRTCQRAGRG